MHDDKAVRTPYPSDEDALITVKTRLQINIYEEDITELDDISVE